MHLGGKKPRKISDLLAMIMFAFKPKEFNRRLRSVLIILEGMIVAGLCSSRARWSWAPNFCPWVTRKSQILHTNHTLGTLDFTVSEH